MIILKSKFKTFFQLSDCVGTITALQTRLVDVAVFENRQLGTKAKFINKSSLFILLLNVIRRLELKPISEQKDENIFVTPPYCQTAS